MIVHIRSIAMMVVLVGAVSFALAQQAVARTRVRWREPRSSRWALSSRRSLRAGIWSRLRITMEPGSRDRWA